MIPLFIKMNGESYKKLRLFMKMLINSGTKMDPGETPAAMSVQPEKVSRILTHWYQDDR